MSGHTPFEAPTPPQIYEKAKRGTAMMTFPYGQADPEAMDIVKQLLKVNPSERLTMRPGLVKNLKNHPWYVKSKFDWTGLYTGKLQPPYVPQVKNATDMQNFRARESDIPPQVPYIDPKTGWDKDFASAPNS